MKDDLRFVTVVTYGRTALLRLDGEPAVELLEIVTPESAWE